MGHIRLWKTMAEEHLKASGLAYTIVGPGGLSDLPAGAERVAVVERSQYVSTNVSRADVARIIIDSLSNPDARNKSFALVGERRGDAEAWRSDLRALPRDSRTAPSLDALSWMSGHWRSANDGQISEEIWTSAAAGSMVGVGRQYSLAQLSGSPTFEYLRIEARTDGSIVYFASPRGRSPATPFLMTSWDERAQRAVFTSIDNEFPKMLTYWRDGARLRARADGAVAGKRQEAAWNWTTWSGQTVTQ